MPSWTLPAIAALLATALVATGVTAVAQARAADQARAERDALQEQVEELRAEAELLEERLDARPDPLGELLGELLGGGDVGDGLGGLLDGLLDGLLGDGLLGDGASFDPLGQPGAACFTPDLDDGGTGIGDLLGGLTDGLFGGDPSEQDLDQVVTRTSEQVAGLRELSWLGDVEVDFLDDAETRTRLAELSEPDEDDRERLVTEGLLLHALGAAPADLDLEALRQELLGETVAGFYVNETREIVVRVPDSGMLGPTDRITLAHELDHALADQVLGLPDLTAAPFDGDRDARLAALSVIEGDATLLMTLWTLEHLSLAEQLGMAFDPAIAGQQATLDAFPEVLVRELLFPYTAGLDWACDSYRSGGWAAIDAAYVDPPATTYEILYGEPTTASATVELRAPSPAHRERERTTFGAAELRWHLQAPGGDPSAALSDPDGRARAWSGGELVVWDGGPAPAVGLAMRDRGASPLPLCATMTAWATAAFPTATTTPVDGGLTLFDGPRSAAVSCTDQDVVVGLAADVEVARTVASG